MEYRARYSDGTLRLITNDAPDIPPGEVVHVTIERGRSMASHRHQFAWIKDAWLNLPEALRDAPWAETPENMRKHALIATGFHQATVIDCGANATARRVRDALLTACIAAHGYAVAQVRGPVVTVWTPESQSYRAMGGDRFKASKAAIMEWIAAQIGVTTDELRRSAA